MGPVPLEILKTNSSFWRYLEPYFETTDRELVFVISISIHQ